MFLASLPTCGPGFPIHVFILYLKYFILTYAAWNVTFRALEFGKLLSMLESVESDSPCFGTLQVSAFTVHLLLTYKKKSSIFERVPLSWLWFEPGISHTIDNRLTTWSIQASLALEVHWVNYVVNAAIASQSQCAHQGYNSIGWLLQTFFLENSRPTACYFQWNS